MKKISSLASCMLLAMGLLTTSCSNDESMETPNAEVTQQMTRSQAVDILKNMNFDHALSEEIHGCVTNSLASGRDEYVRLSELMSKETRSGGQSLFATRLINLFMDKYITRSIEAEDMLKELTNSDFIIYWPYSEDWDGEELPTLVAAPDNEDATEAIGVKIIQGGGEVSYEDVLVDEDYMMQHPVWVVDTKAENPNVVYITPSNGENEISRAPRNITRAGTDTIHVWRLQKMQVTHQYDGPFKGGPDFEIHIAYPTMNGSVNTPTIHKIDFSRKDVKKKRWKELNLVLNSDWTKYQIDNGIFIIEQDWDGARADVTQELSVSYQDANGTTYSSTATIKYSKNDEFIGKQTVKRSFMLHNSNLSFDNNRVNMIAPIEVEVY